MTQEDILSEEQCQLLVDALLKGNEEFCEEMKAKEKTEPIYSAAKNGRGNKIDSRLIKTFANQKISFIQDYSIKKLDIIGTTVSIFVKHLLVDSYLSLNLTRH
ncbi:TPA: hypothetical protein ACJS0R_001620 [Streptococcus agalactiae]